MVMYATNQLLGFCGRTRQQGLNLPFFGTAPTFWRKTTSNQYAFFCRSSTRIGLYTPPPDRSRSRSSRSSIPVVMMLCVVKYLCTGWFTYKKTNVFLGECPQQFLDSDREILRTSSMCHCKNLACSFFFFCLSIFFVKYYYLENMAHRGPT